MTPERQKVTTEEPDPTCYACHCVMRRGYWYENDEHRVEIFECRTCGRSNRRVRTKHAEERGRLLKLLRTIKPWVDHEDGPPSGTTFDEIDYVRSELDLLLAKLEGKPR